jgi:hypothetical protein
MSGISISEQPVHSKEKIWKKTRSENASTHLDYVLL